MAGLVNTTGQVGAVSLGAVAASKLGFLGAVEPWFDFVGLVIGGLAIILKGVELWLKHKAQARKRD